MQQAMTEGKRVHSKSSIRAGENYPILPYLAITCWFPSFGIVMSEANFDRYHPCVIPLFTRRFTGDGVRCDSFILYPVAERIFIFSVFPRLFSFFKTHGLQS